MITRLIRACSSRRCVDESITDSPRHSPSNSISFDASILLYPENRLRTIPVSVLPCFVLHLSCGMHLAHHLHEGRVTDSLSITSLTLHSNVMVIGAPILKKAWYAIHLCTAFHPPPPTNTTCHIQNQRHSRAVPASRISVELAHTRGMNSAGAFRGLRCCGDDAAHPASPAAVLLFWG